MTDNVTDSFLGKTISQGQSIDVRDFEEWMAGGGTPAQAAPQGAPAPAVSPTSVPWGAVQPTPRKRTADVIGRPQPKSKSLAGTIVRNVAEIPGQIVGGVHDAVANAIFWAIDPLANWLNENVADLSYNTKDMPIIHDPRTATGGIVRSASQFLSGFIPGLRTMGKLGVTNKVAAPITAGMLADFATRDGHDAKLADLWNQAGLPKNVLTDYLASDKNDSEVEGRFKNALEGAGFGILAEGVFMAARALRSARGVKEVKQAEEQYLRGKYGEVTDDHIRATGLGDTKSAVVEIGGPKVPVKVKPGEVPPLEARALIRKRGAKAPTDTDVYVNFARFDEPEQVKFVIGKMAESMKGQIDEATRGKITQDETVKLAENLGMSVDDLLARRQGQGFNAEEAVAARQLWAASGEKLLEIAKKAASPEASAVDHFAFRKMMATHAAIQAEVIGARTETARALAAWKIPVKGNIERARLIDQVLEATGGAQTSAEMAKRLVILADSGAHPSVVGNFAFKGYGAATSDAIKELWVNGLLSSPETHVVNAMSNTIVAFQSIYERGIAAALNKAVGGGIDGVQPGEATAMAFGLIGGIKDSFRLAAQYLKTGESQFTFGKIDLLRPDAISSEAFNMSRSSGLGRGLDYLGKVVGTPMHMLGAADEFFKSIGYRMELRAQALRTASQEGFSGADLVKRTAELIDNPTESMRIAAADNALYQTFTNEMGRFGSTIMHLRNIDAPLNPTILILPFVRTPVNIARYVFERTPFAPLVSQWRADIAAGGARADLALARMSSGTAIMLAAMDYADTGLITGEGPKNINEREALLRQGWQPFSVKVGDRWYSYNRVDPFGMTVGFAASISEAVKKGEIDEDDVDEWQEVAAMSIAAVSQVAISKTFLEGFSNFVGVMSDPKRHSESYIKQLFASFLPATSLNAAVKNFVDPIQREAGTPMEAVQARIAGLSDSLPPKRNLWGDEISTASGLGSIYDMLTPVASKPLVESPVDREIARMGDGPSRIQKKTLFDGVQVNFKKYPKAYDDYVRLAGNELKHPAWQMGAKDYLDAVVGGNHPMSISYKILSDEGRKAFIQNTISQYRGLAQQQVLAMHPDFAQEIGRLKALQAANRLPVMGE